MIKLYLYARRYLSVLLVCCSLGAFAQQTVTGKVTSSDDGSPIPGVNILEKGTTNGTVTDGDGKFSISVGSNATLLLSFVGYVTQEVSVGSQTSVNVVLVSDITALSEVLVVGYGSQDKKEITGAVTSVDASAFNKGMINDPTQLLQGKVAGLSIYNKGGDPNSSAVIRLRGISTVGANASPLVVVDGVLGASLDNVDPNDIETINVLKDGSASAIYGSRGSAGVILVTTKRGSSKGGVNVSYNTFVSASEILKKVPVMTPDQYIAAGGNDLGARTDWQNLVTRTAISNVHNVAISGGNENTTFRASTNFRNINGILKNSGWDQINTRAGLTHNALDGKLKININFSFTNRNIDYSFNEALRYATLYNPTAPVYFPNGDYYQAILFDNFNPVAILNQNVNQGNRKNFTYGAKVDYSIAKNLTFSVNYGQQYQTETRSEYYSSKSLFRGLNRNGLARRYSGDASFTLFEAFATYSKQMDKVNMDITAGYSYQEDKSQNFFAELGNFPSDALGYNSLQNSGDRISGLAANVNISSDASPTNKIIAQFARINFTFDNAIFFNASVRREGSTKLGKNNQWGVFPSVGAGVELNKYLQVPSFSTLRLRVGYGITGSLPPTYGYAQDEYTYSFSSGGTVTKTRDANPDLKWEQKAETNIGVDFGLRGGKFTGSVDWFTRTISDFIQLQNVQAGQGAAGQQYKNSGSLRTTGFEVTLNYNALRFGDLSWTPGLVVTRYASTLESYITKSRMLAELGAPGQNGTYMVKVAEGEEIGQIWGPVFDHVSTGTGADASVAKGAPVFKDLDGNGSVDANPANALTSKDFQKLGNGLPAVELGWSNRLTYRNWDFNVFFRATLGHSLVNNFRAFYEPIDPGAINSYNRIITSKAPAGLTSAQYSSLYVEKADFVKLDNMTVGYNFKLGNSILRSARIYASGQNLFQITSYTGIDPEPVLQDLGSVDNGGFNTNAPNILAPGIDRRNNYFTARTFTLGLTVGF